ncbi:metal ABC transporter ATP-binding protein [Mycetocola spongiae]|uniref:metal ABC transporter ATP-binding protein n=1 Tax=Mycetocola spongiae TaxID=2859226 RepID=UPI001CF494C1|nr:ATP-binding cassette domain-containing protein [Mycetocola spongiae]UCR88942.1 ATP-binding cassette domain-containing protein [Mycetocola spongiae]
MIFITNKGVFMSVVINAVHFSYRDRVVFEDLSVTFPGSTITAITGANGSGKSTLIGLLTGILRPQRGDILLPRGGVAFIPQGGAGGTELPLTLAETVAMGTWRNRGLRGRVPAARRERAALWIHRLGLDAHARSPLAELSGGQRQRALLAQGLVQDTPVLILDEPDAHLDAGSRELIAEVLAEAAAGGRTVIIATHDPEAAARATTRVHLEPGN